MKKLLTTIIILIVAYLAWYLGSPLFIDNVVEEDFPVSEVLVDTEASSEVRSSSSSEDDDMEELKELENLTAEAVEQMTDEEKEEVKEKMDDYAERMPETVVEDEMEDMPEETGPLYVAAGQFVGADAFHKASGTATLYQVEGDQKLLRFEGFSVTNGPALSVFLQNDAGEKVEIAKLKGNKGNQNYTIPASVDTDEYNTVLIYCVPFKVDFGTAVLQ